MQRIHNYEVEGVEKLGWTKVVLSTWPDNEIDTWLREHNSVSSYIHSYFACSWYFESADDALLFKLKFGSYKGNFNNPFGIDYGDNDINSMYPTTIKVIKPRSQHQQAEFQQMYMGTFPQFDCEYEGIILKDYENAVYDPSRKKTKMRP